MVRKLLQIFWIFSLEILAASIGGILRKEPHERSLLAYNFTDAAIKKVVGILGTQNEKGFVSHGNSTLVATQVVAKEIHNAPVDRSGQVDVAEKRGIQQSTALKKRTIPTSEYTFLENSSQIRHQNPSGVFDCHLSPLRDSEEYLYAHGGEWPLEAYRAYTSKRTAKKWVGQGGNSGKLSDFDSDLPYCPQDGVLERFSTIDAHDGFQRKRVKKLLSTPVSSLFLNKTWKAGMPHIILIAIENFVEGIHETLANSLCALRRLGRSNQTLVYVGGQNSPHVVHFQNTYSEVLFIDHSGLKDHVLKAHKDSVWLQWRYVPVLELLELGHPVISSDVDVHWMRDPFALPSALFATSTHADIVGASEGCLEWNAGVVLYRPTDKSKTLLRQVIGTENVRSGNWTLDASDDQWALSCAIINSVLNNDLKISTSPRSITSFGFPNIYQYFARTCYEHGADLRLESLPFSLHTTGSDGGRKRSSKLRALGLLEAKDAGTQEMRCVSDHDHLVKCRQGFGMSPSELQSLLA